MIVLAALIVVAFMVGGVIGWYVAMDGTQQLLDRAWWEAKQFDQHVVDSMTLANFERDDQGLYARSVIDG